jgi:hypothetical protein
LMLAQQKVFLFSTICNAKDNDLLFNWWWFFDARSYDDLFQFKAVVVFVEEWL